MAEHFNINKVILMKFKIYTFLFCLIFSIGCSENAPYSMWETKTFPKTQITDNTMLSIKLVNPSETDEQHVTAIGFNQGGNVGHFQLSKVLVGNREESTTDIVIPPSGELILMVNYSPLNLETTVANYGEWETGTEARWIPTTDESASRTRKNDVIHRSIIELAYDYPEPGLVFYSACRVC